LKIKVSQQDVIRELWRRGDLKYKVREHQIPIYENIKSTDSLKYVLNIARRYGKSTILLIIAIELGLRFRNILIPYIAPSQKMVQRIIQPLVTKICEDAPVEYRPRWNTLDQAYVFHNGSKLFVAGTDKEQYENLRGIEAVYAFVDEAGFCENLRYIVGDILLPATLTTKGKIVIVSTPPKTPAHDFYYICMEAESNGSYEVRTIDDNVSIDAETKEKYLEEAGGRNSSTAKREYFCKFEIDEESAIFPEFSDEMVREILRPSHFSLYGALDPGYKDNCAYLLGYYDFQEARYYIEGEVWTKGKNSEKIAKEIKKVESKVFPDKPVHLRVSDTDLILIADLNELHGIQVISASKKRGEGSKASFKEKRVNAVRVLMQRGQIFVHPRCKNFIRQLKTGIWDKQRKSFERMENEGHFDLLDAFVYLIDVIDIYSNPYPALAPGVREASHYIDRDKFKTRNALERLINV